MQLPTEKSPQQSMPTRPEPPRRKSVLREWTEFIVTLVLMVFFIRVTTVEAFRIPTGSMEDTLLIGDFLLVNKFVYGIHTPDWIGIPFTKIGFHIPATRLPGPRKVTPGDIIVFKYPPSPMWNRMTSEQKEHTERVNYIKRCIAGPGQTVEIREAQVYVDGKPFVNPPHSKFTKPTLPANIMDRDIFAPPGANWNRDNYGPITVPPGHFWAMGDNRDNSADSRYWGFLSEDDVVGEALVIYLSVNKFVPMSKFWEFIRWNRMASMIH
ncbi:MAG TPA: signal peptidase I [bacterium]